MLRALLPLALLAIAAPAAAVADDPDAVVLAQLTIRERIIIRLPRVPRPQVQPAATARAAPPTPVRYKEGKGPSCVAAGSLAGAAIRKENVVDLSLAGGTMLRAQLDGDCAPLDFYSGFYLRPAADGQVCAGRDAIRVRSGASCTIKRFRTLTPRR